MMPLVVGLFYFMYRLIYRQRGEVIDGNTSLSVALTRVRQYSWAKNSLWCAYLTALFAIAMWLAADNATAVLLASLAYMLLLVTVVCRTEFAAWRAQAELSRPERRGLLCG